MTSFCTYFWLLLSHAEAGYEWEEEFHCSFWQWNSQLFLITFSLYLSSPCQRFFLCEQEHELDFLICFLFFFTHSRHFTTSHSIGVMHCKPYFFSYVHIKAVWSQMTHLSSFLLLSLCHTVSTCPAPSRSSCTVRATCAPVWRSTSTSPSTIWRRSTSLWLSRRPAPSKVGLRYICRLWARTSQSRSARKGHTNNRNSSQRCILCEWCSQLQTCTTQYITLPCYVVWLYWYVCPEKLFETVQCWFTS